MMPPKRRSFSPGPADLALRKAPRLALSQSSPTEWFLVRSAPRSELQQQQPQQQSWSPAGGKTPRLAADAST